MKLELSLESRSADINGKTVRLTRRETRLCEVLAAHPNQLIGRERLLDTLSQDGLEDLSSRSLDNSVSRLRKKLGDSGKRPQVIETLYGEGYRWVYDTAVNVEQPDKNTLVVLDLSAPNLLDRPVVDRALQTLQQQLSSQLECTVRLGHMASNEIDVGADPTHYYLEALPLSGPETMQMVLNIRRHQSALSENLGQFSVTELTDQASPVVDAVHSFMVRCDLLMQTEGLTANPLDVALFNVTSKYENDGPQHRVTQQYLNNLMHEQPDDPHAKVLMALNMRNRILMGYVTHYQKALGEMQSLIQTALPYLDNEALYLAASAEVLYQCGDKTHGRQLAEKAHGQMSHPAATLKTVGKIHAFEGRFDQALDCYDQAIAMIPNGGTYHYMLLTLKAILFKANREHDALSEAFQAMKMLEPKLSKRAILSLMLYDGERKMTFAERTLLKSLPRPLIDRIVRLTFIGSARSFMHETHRMNLMKPLLDALYDLRNYVTNHEDILASLPEYSNFGR
ncbi:winged helix-turn-helix domain-containing protein [Reinekea blandensis]|uniref:Putative regulatory protein n=1 Tax=Reinekea blandensis MED297 TaxID=314283 RepID=A4BGW4_9GAMM|nr:winged helix-turn-helix domain-containing protein [Reinekea blandensis]EAR08610.1 putative regulatory protein [Reinekea sp. MED297] [Reinekea blandensis MED297]